MDASAAISSPGDNTMPRNWIPLTSSGCSLSGKIVPAIAGFVRMILMWFVSADDLKYKSPAA